MGRLGSGVVYSSAVQWCPHVILFHLGLWIFPGGFCVQPWPELTHSTVNTTQLKLQHKEKSSFYLICGFAERWANVYSGGRVVSPLTWIVTSDGFVKIIQCNDVLKEQFIEATFEKLIGSQQQRERILWTSNLPPLGAARKQLLWSRSHSWRFDKQWGEVGWRAEGGGARWRWWWWWRRADEAELVE